MDKHLRFNKRCKLALLLLLSVAGMMKTIAENPPTGAIDGLFSVSAGRLVYFSQGNLQYQASTNTWQFAEHQYDYVGFANSAISQTNSGWIDLFGWGTSGYHDANDPYNVNYRPWSTSNSEVNSDYNRYGYGPSTNMTDFHLTGTSANYDWGVYNPISNGGNQTNQWRTLTQSEWAYVFNTRTTTSGIRYAKAKVNNVNGVILLPDDWSNSTYSLSNTNSSEANYSSNTITASQWTTLENAGAVFLPAAGIRDGTSVTSVGLYGHYWSTSGQFSYSAYRGVFFYDSFLNTNYNSNFRYYGQSVRLVRVAENYFSINAVASPAEGGAVSGGGIYALGAECMLTATANAGFTFTNWTKNGSVVSTQANYTFTVTGNRTLVANFTQQQFTITAIANPTEGGTVAGGGTYNYGQSCTLNATPNVGYTFSNWTENGEEVSNDATYSFTVTGDRTLVANFSEIPPDNHWTSITGTQYNLTMSGLIYIDGVAQTSTALEIGAFCGDECRGSARAQYFPPTNEYVVSLAVVSNQQSGETITFRLYDHETQQEFPSECVNSITFVANANFGEMGNWYSFAFNNTVAIAATVTPEGSGAVEGIGDYLIGTSCTLTATANTGYTFVDWTRNGTVVSTNASYTFTVTEACSYVAHFQLNSYQITASATPSAGGSVSGSGTYSHGSSCTLTATNNTGYTFVDWTRNGTVVSTNASYTFTVTEACSYVAHFQLNSYQITASATPSAGGSVSGAGTYNHGSNCTLTATNNTGYTFVNWTENGSVVSTDNPYTFTVNGAVELTANFSLNSYDITASANPAEGGTITGTGAYDHFSTCTLTATANTGYVFRSWSVAGEVVSTDNPYTFTVSGGVEVTANFDAQETTVLAEGWTWWSTSIELSDIDGLTMLEESLGHNGLMIKSANKFVQNYYPSTGYDYWFGQLTSNDFTNASSYMIQTSASCDVTMTGTYADPSDHPIQLYPGWTWIGYPCGTDQSASSAFANFTPTANDKVKSQYAFSTYYDNYGWFPEFTMTPGEGYLYQSLASDIRTLTFVNGSKDNPQTTNMEDHYWRNNVHTYADNMNVIAVVTINGEEQQGEDLELGAFVDGECRGSAVLKHFQPTDRWYAMLTVAGTDGEQIEFGIIDKGKGLTSMTSDRNLAFQANAVVGELDEPYTIGFGTLGCVENNLMGMMHIYPNPIDRNTAFSIVIPETETVRSIYIVNMMGEVMAHETNMTRSLAIQVPGVYTIKVVCHSDNVYVRKLIVK